jgi:hypothetical protein
MIEVGMNGSHMNTEHEKFLFVRAEYERFSKFLGLSSNGKTPIARRRGELHSPDKRSRTAPSAENISVSGSGHFQARLTIAVYL